MEQQDAKPETTSLLDAARTRSMPPQHIVISAVEARQIVEKYGELTFKTWARYRGVEL